MDDSTTSEKLKKEDWFQININNPKSASPTLAFTWRINTNIKEKLKEENVAFPFLLVTVLEKRSNSNSPWLIYRRALYPLDQAMAYIDFNKPGEFEFVASVIWLKSVDPASWSEKEVRKAMGNFLSVSGYDYQWSLHDGYSYRPDFMLHYFDTLDYHDQVEVEIDKNLFADEPPAWLAKWVNLYHRSKPKDECDFRRRAILSVPKLLFAFLLHAPTLIIHRLLKVALMLMIGARPRIINWKYIFQPFEASHSNVIEFDDVIQDKNNWFTTKKSGQYRSTIERCFLFLSSWILFIVAVVSVFNSNSIARSLALTFAICIFAWVILKALSAFGLLRGDVSKEELYELVEKAELEKKKHKERKFKDRLSRYYEERISPLACETRPKEANLRALPTSHRTVWLRFRDIKAKVCKPMRS